jgi:TolB-like protein/tRNA A-37 threonylcarbamoyl transferase component Bud32
VSSLLERLQTAVTGRYRVDEELGGGGMSRVFLAHDTTLGRRVVIKVLPPEMAAGVNVERFRREIQLAASLQHPHIVPLLAAEASGDLLYYTMPLVTGESLRARMAREGELPIGEAVRILRDAADALAYAHEHGVVHRDIKPDNILLSGRHALVTDFGVAKAVSEATGEASLTSVGVALGTPAYMAPEQAVADPHVDHRADIYALGVLGYEMLTGEPPFKGPSPQALLAAHVTQQPEPITDHRASVPAPLAQLLMRCLEKKPADRWQSAVDLHHALGALGTPSEGLTPADTAPVAAVPPAPRMWKRPALIGAAAVVVLAAGFGALRLMRPGPSPAPGAAEPTLVVLPFESIGEATDQSFGDGVSEEITTRLSRLSGLKVIARSSALRYRESGTDAQSFGRSLGADYVLDGTVRWVQTDSTPRARITPALIQVSDAQQVWGDAYDVAVADPFGVQADVSEKVANALQVRLGADEHRTLRDAGTADAAAQRAYLVGRFQWRKRTQGGLQEAARAFQQAIDSDPGYARAYAGLADAIGLFPYYGITTIPKAEAYDRAERAARRAIALDSTLGEAWASLGEVLTNGRWDWPGAERALRRAIQLDPSYATGYQWLGEVLLAVGRLDEAVTVTQRGVDLDPLSAIVANAHGLALYYAGRVDSARAEFRRALDLQADQPSARSNLRDTFLYEGQDDSAKAAVAAIDSTGRQIGGDRYGLTLIDAMVHPERRGEARALLFGDPERRAQLSGETLMELLAHIGPADSAFVELNRLIDARDEGVLLLQYDPLLEPLYRDPRWRAAMRRMGFTP